MPYLGSWEGRLLGILAARGRFQKLPDALRSAGREKEKRKRTWRAYQAACSRPTAGNKTATTVAFFNGLLYHLPNATSDHHANSQPPHQGAAPRPRGRGSCPHRLRGGNCSPSPGFPPLCGSVMDPESHDHFGGDVTERHQTLAKAGEKEFLATTGKPRGTDHRRGGVVGGAPRAIRTECGATKSVHIWFSAAGGERRRRRLCQWHPGACPGLPAYVFDEARGPPRSEGLPPGTAGWSDGGAWRLTPAPIAASAQGPTFEPRRGRGLEPPGPLRR